MLVSLPTIVLVSLTLILMQWHTATRIVVHLIARRVSFVAAQQNADPYPFFDKSRVEAITIRYFDSIKLSPKTLQVADPLRYDVKNDSFPRDAWTFLKLNKQEISFAAENSTRHPRITIESAPGSNNWLTLSPVFLKGGSQVTLDYSDPRKTGSKNRTVDLALKTSHQDSPQEINVNSILQLVTEHCDVEGVENPFPDQTLTYQVGFEQTSNSIEITNQHGTLSIILTVEPDQAKAILQNDGLPVIHPDFSFEDPLSHNAKTSLVEDNEGWISYPDEPAFNKATFRAPEFILFGQQDRFIIKKMALNEDKRGIEFEIDGVAQLVRTGMSGLWQDHRLTAFDKLSKNVTVITLFGIVCWFFPTTLAVYRFVQNLKSGVM